MGMQCMSPLLAIKISVIWATKNILIVSCSVLIGVRFY
uniref:Uncharacterized protein n=1 Tax=Arundo donax TaxID=35708 RepID=A0A0A9BSM4_ARUDO